MNTEISKDIKINMNGIYSVVTIIKNLILCLALFASEPNDEQKESLNIPNDLNLDDFSHITHKTD